MSNPFRSADWRELMNTLVSPAIDDAFGETLRIIPCERKTNQSAVPDHANAVTLQGVFSWRSKTIWQASEHDPTAQLPVVSRDPIACFARNVFRASEW